ncbi:nesprin-2a [Entelurus aequoreus]|uniref:nesprin-2a n=1 Tax=Entelurus aequoreus TaxID=161455 RepID=UPI002B1E3963|nr:nesprin-2a [Entelurus aequoreus]
MLTPPLDSFLPSFLPHSVSSQTQYLTPPKAPSPISLPVHYTPAISTSPLRQATPDRKAQEVSCWLLQAYEELLEGWNSTEDETYSERYQVFQTFLVSFNEQRRPIMPLLTAMRRSSKLSEEQRALREAWDALTEKLREYKIELDVRLPAPLDLVARWLLRTEAVLAEEEGDPLDHGRAADEAKEKQEQLKVCQEEMPQQLKTFQAFLNQDVYGNMLVPAEKIEELKRRFTGVRVSAKYHGIKLEYLEHRHTVLDLLGQIWTKVRLWKRPYLSPEAIRVLLQEWNDLVNNREIPSTLEAALRKLKQVAEKYSSKSALAADYPQVCQQVTQIEEDTAAALVEVTSAKSALERVLTAWDSYSDGISSMEAWLEQSLAGQSYGPQPKVTSESLAEWGSRLAHLSEVANFLMESTDPQSSKSLAGELQKLKMNWEKFNQRNTLDSTDKCNVDIETRPQDLQALVEEASLLLKEPVETMAGPLRIYRKRIQFMLRKIKEVDLESLDSSSEGPSDELKKLKMTMLEAKQTLCEAEKVCADLQHSVSGLDSRLAELLHWETETRDLYQLLKASELRQQRGQDPRAKVAISRGLQLEGQVVTEEQDLQVLIKTHQKNSPIQCLQASTIQGRVRATVAHSQEVVGLLSSLGARRDRSRSPTGGPPSKVFIQAKTKPHHLRQLGTGPPTQECTTLSEFHPSQKAFVPKIVVQEYREDTIGLPPVSYSSAQEEMQTSPTQAEGQTQAWAVMTEQEQTAENTWIQQQQLNRAEAQDPKYYQAQAEVLKEKENTKKETQIHKDGEQQLEEMEGYKEDQSVLMHVEVERKLTQTTAVHELTSPVKKPLKSQELQCKKARGLKNRPWLKKTGEHDIQSPNKDSAQKIVQATQPQKNKDMIGSTEVVHHHTVTSRTQPETQDKSAGQSTKRKKLKEQQQKQQMPIVVAQPEEGTRNKSKAVELPLQQANVKSQPSAEMMAQSQVQPQPLAHSQVIAQGLTWAQVSPLSPIQAPLQDNILPPVPSHIQLRSHPQSWSPVRPPSPKPPAQAQSPTHVITHAQVSQETIFQMQRHPQLTQPENQTMLQPQSHSPLETQTQIYAAQPQTSLASMARAQTHPLSKTQPVTQSQVKPQTVAKIQQNVQPKTQIQAPVHAKTKPQISLGSTAHEQTQFQQMTQPQKFAKPMIKPQAKPEPITVVQTHPLSKAQSQSCVYAGTQSHVKLHSFRLHKHRKGLKVVIHKDLKWVPQGILT